MIKTLDECKSAVIDFLEKSKTKYCTEGKIKNNNYPLQYVFQEMMDCNFNKDADQAHTDLIAFRNDEFLDGMETKFDSFSGANEIAYSNEETEFDNGSQILT